MSVRERASSPGHSINRLLGIRSIEASQLQSTLNLSTQDLENLLCGSMPITIEIAKGLTSHLGGTVGFWITRDANHRTQSATIEETSWLREIPRSEITKMGWLNRNDTENSEEKVYLRFFGVNSVRDWRAKYSTLETSIAFRRSAKFESDLGATAAWLRQGEIEAGKIHASKWDPMLFKAALAECRLLTRVSDTKKFIPLLQAICASAGVRVVIVKAPKGCRASGAARWLSDDTPLIQLSYRYKTDDHFWFSFFHESGHIILHEHKDFYELDAEKTSKIEEEANTFSARCLIPEKYINTMKTIKSYKNAMKFAKSIGISPGIVAGQLQFYGFVPRTNLNKLKRDLTFD